MANNKANVLVGAATIYVDDNNLGWTSGGLTIEHSADFYNVEVDQEPNPVKSFRVKETFKIKTNLAENTLENLKIAWGIDSSIDLTTTAGYRRLAFGGSVADAPEHTLDVYGNAPGTPSRQRRIHFYRVVAVEFGNLVVEKGKEQVIPVTFEAYIDSTQSNGKQIGYIEDQTVRESKNLVMRVTVA
jgi:hypothetical protein